MAQIVCFGEILMRLTAPERELLLQSPRLAVYFGGAEANVAVSLSVLGHHSSVVTTLPNSSIGRACAGDLQRYGVDTRGVQFAEGRMGLYFLSTGALHRPSDVIYDRAASAFSLAPAANYQWSTLLQEVDWLHLSGITPALSTQASVAALDAVTTARTKGVKISFDCNFRHKLWINRLNEAPKLLQTLASHTDLLFGNSRDIALMLGMPTPNNRTLDHAHAAAAFAAWPSVQHVAATERSHNTVDHQEIAGLLISRSGFYKTRSYALRGIVDRIGSGDAFAAGLLHGLLQNMDEAKALDFAMAAACLKHSVPGDANLLRESDMLDFMQEEGLDIRR